MASGRTRAAAGSLGCSLQQREGRCLSALILLQDGTTIPYGLCIWSTGVGPTPFVLRWVLVLSWAGQTLGPRCHAMCSTGQQRTECPVRRPQRTATLRPPRRPALPQPAVCQDPPRPPRGGRQAAGAPCIHLQSVGVPLIPGWLHDPRWLSPCLPPARTFRGLRWHRA